MWRLARDDPERGAIAPMTALLMVGVLGMAAFAVDVATMYSEHAQLQNGADASALAIAQSCAAETPGPECSDPEAAAGIMGNGNALDGHSNALTATVSGGIVDVTTQSQDPEGNNRFSLVFARVLGIDTSDIRASARAQFGAYSAADGVPLTFSKCEADPTFFKGLQFFPTHGSTLSDDPAYACEHSSASGHELAGGFGWIKDADGGCKVHIDVTNPWVEARTGNSFESDCDETVADWKVSLEAGKTVEVLIPIFDTACPEKTEGGEKGKGGGKGTAGGGETEGPCADSPFGKAFRIEAFAQISIQGWHLNGGGTSYLTPDAQELKESLDLKNSDEGLYGTFVKKVTLAEAATLGGPATYGATGVQLIN
ncbi:TadE/TadG family type IV pilus assembly protein [Arthrobacter sp. QXT-31]|uniref:TadE/TadG family type IV pilus assembly protein n=1 Tax=Arthrobacter sp. QXT-31 TaxID=1357915 RepID=UPI00097179B5|nr:Tad domain-containing protein [Arthrobacter sp. QXT-31]APX03145.1 hypothetical protein BWQ92_16755 [Arthrobacter sp. QXT-31]